MSSSKMTERIDAVTHEVDPKEEIHTALDGYLDMIEPTGTDLLVCVYERPTTKTITGLTGEKLTLDLSASNNLLEDKYQGKVCLVMKRGPNVEDSAKYFKNDTVPAIDDWVLVPVSVRSVQFLMGVEAKTRHVALVPVHLVAAVLANPDCFL